MFNLDMSRSMQSIRWMKVKNAVNNFIGGLCNHDLVCGLIFNNYAKIITNLSNFKPLIIKYRYMYFNS